MWEAVVKSGKVKTRVGSSESQLQNVCVCVYVCVCERERERELERDSVLSQLADENSPEKLIFLFI